jgi:glycosyltransferase involved in cell wall biosynthesis
VLRRQVVWAGGGLYYDTDTELREAMIRLLSRPRDGSAFGRAGRAFVETRYTWPRIREAYLTLYDRVMRG